MAIDIIARGMAGSLLDENGKLKGSKLPTLPSSETGAAYTLGGIPVGADLNGMTIEEILTLMLFGVVNPTFTEPSFKVTVDDNAMLIGSVGQSAHITGAMAFDRGAITPANGTSGFRAGAPVMYTYNGEIEGTNETNVNYELTIDDIKYGDNIVEFSVTFEKGEQPLDSTGNAYDKPYPSGTLKAAININGMYSIFVADAGTGAIEEHHASVSYFDDETGSGYMVNFDAELNGYKQTVYIAEGVDVVGIKQFNIRTQAWDWLYGDAESSLGAFDTRTATADELNTDITYIAYTNNIGTLGERSLRFYIALKD